MPSLFQPGVFANLHFECIITTKRRFTVEDVEMGIRMSYDTRGNLDLSESRRRN